MCRQDPAASMSGVNDFVTSMPPIMPGRKSVEGDRTENSQSGWCWFAAVRCTPS